MSNETKHSPTPWRVEKNLYGTANIIETEGRQIAACTDGVRSFDPDEEEASAKQDEANAAFIVECVNTNERLVEENEALRCTVQDAAEYEAMLKAAHEKEVKRLRDLVRRMKMSVKYHRAATGDYEILGKLLRDANAALEEGEEACNGND